MKKSEILIAIEHASPADLQDLHQFTLVTMGPHLYEDFKKLGCAESFEQFLLISLIACRAENESSVFVQEYKRRFGEDLYKKCNEIFVRCCCEFFEFQSTPMSLSN